MMRTSIKGCCLALVATDRFNDLSGPVYAVDDPVDEIRPVELTDEEVGFLKAELVDDVPPDTGCGRGFTAWRGNASLEVVCWNLRRLFSHLDYSVVTTEYSR